MKHIYYWALILALLGSISLSSCSDDEEKRTGTTGITSHSWTEETPLEIATGSTLSVSFQAAGEWTATGSAEWCTLTPRSGRKGVSMIRLSTNTTATAGRTATITIEVAGHSPARFEVLQKAGGGTGSEDESINMAVDQYLRKMYLWNDEYKTLELDFTKNYEDFFYDALGSMTSNTLDKKITPDGSRYTLYSYIDKKNPVSKAGATKLVNKELTYSFGITGIIPVSLGTPQNHSFFFCVQGVYPGSPAALAGVKRGSMISHVNGRKITELNLDGYYYDLIIPNKTMSLTLTEETEGAGVRELSITSEAAFCNPVIFSKVEEIEGHKVGYLVYNSFEAGFDQELLEVFKEFKNQQVTDIILDLRYNGGGHVISANLISTCIAGKASQGKVFSSLRYNKERMKALNNQREEDLFAYSHYANLGTSLSAGSLSLNRVYCLVGNGTASASELVINSLRGIDVEVILIGEKTTGKNVGMEYTDITIRENIYRVVPITFQSYNAKGFADFEKGFDPTPGLYMDETNPYDEDDIFYIPRDYGDKGEPLYRKALEQITGHPLPTLRSHQKRLRGEVRQAPPIYRPGRDGMLIKVQ